MGVNSKERLAKVHKDGELQDRIGIQMSEVNQIEIKETSEERTDRKPKTADKERGENYRFMCIFGWGTLSFLAFPAS